VLQSVLIDITGQWSLAGLHMIICHAFLITTIPAVEGSLFFD